ncbi:MAG TPA: hypothetical protein VFX30_03030 [bacterium]|nr:hypothetical protein [bacterium]
MKRILCSLCLAVVLSVSIASVAFGESPAPYGPKGKRFGAGLHLGDPTGFTLKGYLTQRFALDGIVAWSFVDEALTIIGDGTFEILDIPIDSRAITLPFYAGAGVKVGIDDENDDTQVAVRVPVGLAVQWVNHPVEVFLEIAPGVGLAPETNFDLTGGVGVRYYFF